MRMVFREGRTKAVGAVSKIYPHVPIEQSSRHQRVKKSNQDNALHATGMLILGDSNLLSICHYTLP